MEKLSILCNATSNSLELSLVYIHSFSVFRICTDCIKVVLYIFDICYTNSVCEEGFRLEEMNDPLMEGYMCL